MLGTFLLVYLPIGLHLPRSTTQNLVLASTPFGFTLPLLFGYLSDRVGRRRVFVIGAIATAMWMLVFFPLLATRDIALMLTAVIVAQTCAAAMSGPEAAFIAETFTGRLRYSGAGIGASTGALLAGITAPFSVYLFQQYHEPMLVGGYLAAWAVVSLVAAAGLRERRDRDIAVEYDDEAQLSASPVTGIVR
jgi:MFS family permease